MTNNITIITGAGSGVGKAAAQRLAAAGHTLVLAGRTRSALESTATSINAPDRIRIQPTDMGDPEQATHLVHSTIERFGRLDVLINNAAYCALEPLPDTTVQTLKTSLAVNALGPGAAIIAAWPTFLSQSSGCIINITTLGIKDPFPGFFAYASSKAALDLFIKSCATEGAHAGIRAFSIAPGAIETPMLRDNFDENTIPTEACLTPDDVADVILACIQGKRDHSLNETIFLSK